MITEIMANEFIDEDVLEVKKITGKGEVNDTYIFITKVNKYFVRVDPNETTLDRFEKEKWCMDEAKKIGIPTPNVFKTGINNNHPYMIMTYIDGIDADDLPKNKHKEIWETIGKYSRKIHNIKITGYGEKMISPGFFDGTWNEFTNYNIKSLNQGDQLISLGIITPVQSEEIRTIFENLKNENFNFGLVHNDLSLDNIRVSKDGEIYLLDWGSAEVNVVPHIDIIEILESSIEESSENFEIFLKSYGIDRKEYEISKPRIAELKLLQCCDKLRWAIDNKPELIEEKAEIFKNVLKTTIGRYGTNRSSTQK